MDAGVKHIDVHIYLITMYNEIYLQTNYFNISCTDMSAIPSGRLQNRTFVPRRLRELC